jgi:cytochrome c553
MIGGWPMGPPAFFLEHRVHLKPTIPALLIVAALASPAYAQTPAERLPVCLACHGATGTSQIEGIPSLGGMPSEYVVTQLYLFREKIRVVEAMNAMAATLVDDDLQAMGDLIAKLPPPKPAGEPLDAASIDQAQTLASRYHCNSCHGATFSGHDQIPHLAGQNEDYLLKSLTQYKSGARPGYDPAMNEAMQEVRETDIPLLAKFLSRYR